MRGGVGDKAGPERREGAAAADRDLEGAHDPAPVARLDPARRDRVQLTEALEQLRKTARLISPVLELEGLFRETARDLEAVQDGAVVKARAPHEQRYPPAGVDPREHPARLGLERGDGELLRRDRRCR